MTDHHPPHLDVRRLGSLCRSNQHINSASLRRRVGVVTPTLPAILDHTLTVLRVGPRRVGVLLQEVSEGLLRLVAVENGEPAHERAFELRALVIERAGDGLSEDAVVGEVREGTVGDLVGVINVTAAA